MNSLLARYLDGELDEREAHEFLEAIDRDPVLARELERTEQLLAAAAELDDTHTPPAFVDAVMARIAAEEARDPARTVRTATHPRVRVSAARWFRPVAAAVLALVFVGGLRVGSAPEPAAPATEAVATVTASSGLHSVRLVYVPPEGTDPERVYVAGDFNAWNDQTTPLRRVGDAWVTTLMLPPGEYEYMFVENGERWVTDPLALRQRTDGFGGTNAVLDVGV